MVDNWLRMLFEMTWQQSKQRRFVESCFEPIPKASAKQVQTFLRDWAKVTELTVVDALRAWSLVKSLEAVRSQPGDVAECGSFRGGIALLLALQLRHMRIPKKVIVYDSFEGLPEPHPTRDFGHRKGEWAADFSEFVRSVKQLRLEDYIDIRRGWFSSTFARTGAEQEFCLVHVDCDLYRSVRECFEFIYPRLSERGRFVLDDYFYKSPGTRRAAQEWVARTDEVLFLGPNGQVTLVKGETGLKTRASHASIVGEFAQVNLSFSHVRKNIFFRRFLERLYGQDARRLGEWRKYIALVQGRSSL